MEMRRRQGRKRDNGNARRPGLIAFAAGLLVVCALFAGVYAKYVDNWVSRNGQVLAKNFYFTTSLTGDTVMQPQGEDTYNFDATSTTGSWNLYGGTAHNMHITVQNYYDTLRYTEKDITYTATVDSASKAAGVTVEGATGTLAGGQASGEEITLKIPAYTAWKYEDNTCVTLTIKSTAPYTKTFTLYFYLHPTDTTLRYRVEDTAGSPYAQLIIMTNVMDANGESTTVQPYIKWPNELEIDNTNSLTFHKVGDDPFVQEEGMENRNMQISEEFETGRSEAIAFFKLDANQNYACGDTVVEPDASGNYVIDLTTKGS